MEGASCNPPGSEMTSPSLESKRVQPQPTSEQENKPPSGFLRSLAPNYLGAAPSSKLSNNRQDELQGSKSSRVQPPRRPLQPLTIKVPGVNTSSSGQQPLYHGGDEASSVKHYNGGVGEAEEKQIPASVFQFPPPLHHAPPFYHSPPLHHAPPHQAPPHHAPYQNQPFFKEEAPVTCVVEQEGHLCLHLR